MTLISTTTTSWLALRAKADDDARSAALALRLARLIPPGPVVVHDLGSGTGAMPRWLAPRLPGPQEWALRDGDALILDDVDLDAVLDDAGRPITACRMVEHLGDLSRDAFAGASAVTASALLDVVTADEARRIVDACVAATAPALFSLSVTGGALLHPQEPLDALIGAAFDAHQRRPDRGLLGPDAVPVVARLFAAAHWQVKRARTPWRLGRGDEVLIGEWLDGWIGAASEQDPSLAARAEEYRARRLDQASAGHLRVVVPHEDVLAWPG